MEEKQKDLKEGEEYRRLAEQYAYEQMEIDRFRKLTQQDVKKMYDRALEEKFQVRQIEKQMDEVNRKQYVHQSSILQSYVNLGRR